MLPTKSGLTASAEVLSESRVFNIKNDGTQETLWNYYDTLGEFESAVMWKANSISRIRLLPAEVMPGGDAPTPVEDGPSVDAVRNLAGGLGGQAQLLREMTIHLTVPGEGWLVAEEGINNSERWSVLSADELTQKNGKYRKRTGDSNQSWEDLINPMIVRFWIPDTRRHWRARPPAKSAIGALQELDLINKRIAAEITSRLASNGLLLMDTDRLSIGNQPGPNGPDQADPMTQAFVDIARNGIADPVSPSAVLPLIASVSRGGEFEGSLADLVAHVDLTGPMSERLIEMRESAIRRVAASIDQPAEVVLGMEAANHWTAWQMEESAIKIHVAPTMETICHSLTEGYLLPYLQANGAPAVGPNGGQLIMWYDPTELVQRPDHSRNAIDAYDRFEINGAAFRRELGFPEADAPTPEEIDQMAAKALLRSRQRSNNNLDTPTTSNGDVVGDTHDIPEETSTDEAQAEGVA